MSATQAALEQEILALLKDGKARTAHEIADQLVGARDFVAQRETTRVVKSALLSLRRAERVRKLMYGATTWAGQVAWEERYIAWAAAWPVCASCWHGAWGDGAVAAQATGYPQEYCSMCGNLTKHGYYAPAMEVRERRGR